MFLNNLRIKYGDGDLFRFESKQYQLIVDSRVSKQAKKKKKKKKKKRTEIFV